MSEVRVPPQIYKYKAEDYKTDVHLNVHAIVMIVRVPCAQGLHSEWPLSQGIYNLLPYVYEVYE